MAVDVKGPNITGLRELQDLQTNRLRAKLVKKTASNSSQSTDDNLFLQTHAQKDMKKFASDGITTSSTVEDFRLEKEYLQKEVEQLQLQLSKSNSEMKEREKETEKLRQTLKDERAVMAEAGLSASITQKIVDISRKNRDLHAELAREKNKTQRAQEQISELKELIKSHEEFIEESKKESDLSVEQRQRETIHQLQEQLSHAKQKLAEYNTHIQLLKQDLKIAQKVLVKEVGEGATIGSLATSGDGWRGRAQQILTLQNKVDELQKQVDSQGKTSCASNRRAQELDKQRIAVRRIETENKQKMQELKSNLLCLQSEITELKQQNKALKARNHILSSEAKESRSQINLLSSELREKEKTAIQQQEQLQSTLSQRKETHQLNEYEEKLRLLQSQLSHSRGERQRLQQTVSELQTKLSDTQITCSSTSTDASTVSSSSHQQKAAVEKESIRLPPIIKEAGRQKEAKIRSSISAGNELHGKYSSEEFEQVVAVCRVTEVERDRLLGLSQILQQRLDTTYSEMASLRQQLIVSERLSKGIQTKGKTNEDTMSSINDLQEKLLLREDENEVLKEMLRLTQQEKLQDMKLLQNLLHETRQTFNNVLKNT